MNLTEDFKAMLAEIMDLINIFKYYSTYKDSHTTVVPVKRRDPPLNGRQFTTIGGMWTLKHETSSPKFYEHLIKIELKVDTAMELKNFYNHINMCLNAVTGLLEDIIPGYQSINRQSDFSEYFIPDRDHPLYS